MKETLGYSDYETAQLCKPERHVCALIEMFPIVSSIWILGPSCWYCLGSLRRSGLVGQGVALEPCLEVTKATPHFLWLSVLTLLFSSFSSVCLLLRFTIDGEGLLALGHQSPQEAIPPVRCLKCFITAREKQLIQYYVKLLKFQKQWIWIATREHFNDNKSFNSTTDYREKKSKIA